MGGRYWMIFGTLEERAGWILMMMYVLPFPIWKYANNQGSLDIMVQRSGDQGAGTVTFVKNSFYHDAFFLKAQGKWNMY
jgi:hypothetical protein